MICCPHCFQSVFPTNNRCPSCQRDVTEEPNRGLTRFVVGLDSTFPSRCCLCNMPADKVKKVEDWSTTQSCDDDRFGVIRILLSVFSALLVGLRVRMPKEKGVVRKYNKLVFRLPVCSNCKGEEVRVVESFHAQKRIAVLVSEDWAKTIPAPDQV